jgi:hypothetical protein
MSIAHDRATQLLLQDDPELDFDEARTRLERATLHLRLPEHPTLADDAAAYAAVACGRRMFRGGVYVSGPPEAVCRSGPASGRPLVSALERLGARTLEPPPGAYRLVLGAEVAEADLYAAADGWRGRVSPEPIVAGRDGHALSGVMTAALAVATAFRRAVLDDVRAGRRPESLSCWGPDEADAPAAPLYLPRDLWLVGLGNLGQAALLTLSMLPWHDRADLRLLLQDADRVGPENLSVQLLTEPAWLGRPKARQAAEWADALGFRTEVTERRFGPLTRPEVGDPRVVLVGVDNLPARRWAADAGFDVVLDAGLGATGGEAFDLRLHGFPGRRTPQQAWPETSAPPRAAPPRSLQKLVEQGRLDPCGAMTIAGQSVGVPCTALAAAALQVGQLCRLIQTGRCADLVDASLVGSDQATWKLMDGEPRRPAFSAARPG